MTKRNISWATYTFYYYQLMFCEVITKQFQGRKARSFYVKNN